MATNAAVQVYAPEATIAANKQSISGTTTAAVNVGTGTTRIMITCDQDAHIRFGPSTVTAAVTTDWPLWARVPQIFDIKSANHYFTAIRDSADGSLYWVIVQ